VGGKRACTLVAGTQDAPLAWIGEFGGYCCCMQCLLCDAIPYPVVLCQAGVCNSVDEVPVCCHFMLKRVVGEETDGGVS